MELMLIESFPSEDRSQTLVGVSDFILSGVKLTLTLFNSIILYNSWLL